MVVRDLNPKSISTQELYGYINMATREWKDGLLSCTLRELANVPDDAPKWIVLDGDLGAWGCPAHVCIEISLRCQGWLLM